MERLESEAPVGLRECPSCNAKVFEDMEICYVCMHEFEGAAVKSDRVMPDSITHSCGEAMNPVGADAKDEGVIPQAKRAEGTTMPTTGSSEGPSAADAEGPFREELFRQFLEELGAFLAKFAVDRDIGIKQLVPVVGEDASMCPVPDKEVDP